MIYISAQPAEIYFLWQIEVQLQNFRDINIASDNVHILFGFKRRRDIPHEIITFIKEQTYGKFFLYKDTRRKPKYLSSIRPHILKKHFQIHDYLEKRVIFYHDSDIIFRERIDEKRLKKTKNWYLSDTKSYISSDYLKSFGNDFFVSMCAEFEIDPRIVQRNCGNSGGAQYIIKKVNANFWKNVEIKSEVLYNFINNWNNKYTDKSQRMPQAWCADMWAIIWNAWNNNFKTKIDSELDFCWTKSEISEWYSKKILHNAGVFLNEKNQFFSKLLFKHCTPFFVNFSNLPSGYCSSVYIDKIKATENNKKRQVVSNASIIILFQNKATKISNFLKIYIEYIFKNLDIPIYIFESGSERQLDLSEFSHKINYHFIGDKDLAKEIKAHIATKSFILIDNAILLPIQNILRTIEILKRESNILIYPFRNTKCLTSADIDNFKDTLNLNYKSLAKRFFSGHVNFVEAFAMKVNDYIRFGGENNEWSFFLNTGINLEKQSRARIFGYKVRYINKDAYILGSFSGQEIFGKSNNEIEYLRRYKDYKFLLKGGGI